MFSDTARGKFRFTVAILFSLLIMFTASFGCGGSGQTASTPTTPMLSFSASVLNVGSIAVGSSSSIQLTVSNTGTVAVTLSTFTITGANGSLFTESSTCSASLAVNSSCTVTVLFAPTAAGNFVATLNLPNNATGAQNIALSGVGLAPAITLSTTTLALGSVTANTSTSAPVTITNTGTAALTLSAFTITGANANLFSQSTTCGTALASNASCTVTVTFAPLVVGSYSATLNIPNNTSGAQSVGLTGTATGAAITINTSSAKGWVISNGVLTLKFDTTTGSVWSVILAGTSDQLVDTTNLNSDGNPKGFYMDNAGFGAVTGTAGYSNVAATGTAPSYIDWWITYPSSTTNAYTYTMHWVMTASDPGLHVYFVANHATTDIAGSIGQVQWVFRDSLTQFTNTYSINSSVNNPVATEIQLPSAAECFSADTGRQVQDATSDLHGLTDIPSSFLRQLYTKYDHAGYEYLHKAHGLYGSTYGIWTVLPSQESMVGGPSKQDLYFTGNLLMIEAFSDHLDNPITLNTAAGTASSRLFGPYYVRFNRLGQAYTTTGNMLSTPADMYADAVAAGNISSSFYDSEAQLLSAGYVPSTSRGSVSVQVNNVAGMGSTSSKAAWAVLSDPNTNFQLSSQGAQYWADISATGSATFPSVIPGTYRLSVYVLGQFGELRVDGVKVTAGANTAIPTQTFVPENFGTTVFAMGTPDRSSHEFLHGEDSNGYDFKNYWGSYNYWSDFATNSGAAVYYATAVGGNPATNNLNAWNYVHWGGSDNFDPGLFGGFFCGSSDDTTDGYSCAIPSYVASLGTAAGTEGVATPVPNWQIHFATPANYASYQYATLSVSVACAYGSYVVSLNNNTSEIWHYTNYSDCMIRSGLSGFTQWFVMQFPIGQLNKTVGGDNVLSIGMSGIGSEDDAIRLELSNTSAQPATTGWNDYAIIYGTGTTQFLSPNDAVPNP